jgi:hypothetical protein
MAKNGMGVDGGLLNLASQIMPGERYAGTEGELLSRCIMRHQKLRGGIIDGRVSPISNSSGSYQAGSTWLLIPLNVHISIQLGSLWYPPHT